MRAYVLSCVRACVRACVLLLLLPLLLLRRRLLDHVALDRAFRCILNSYAGVRPKHVN